MINVSKYDNSHFSGNTKHSCTSAVCLKPASHQQQVEATLLSNGAKSNLASTMSNVALTLLPCRTNFASFWQCRTNQTCSVFTNIVEQSSYNWQKGGVDCCVECCRCRTFVHFPIHLFIYSDV